MLQAIFTLILLLFATVLVMRSALSVAHVVVLSTLPLALGCWLLAGEALVHTVTAALLTVSLGLVVAGYFVMRRFTNPERQALRLGPDGGRRYVFILVLSTGFFTFLYFAIGGVPILSHSIETRRFEFNNSGLFGIPGRMYLYGLPLATGAAIVRARQLGISWYSDRLTLVAVSLFFVSRLLSGFKSGLLEVLIVLIVATVLAQGPVTSVAHVLRRYLPLAVAAVVGIFLVGGLYSSYRGSGRSLPNAILARATTKAALPGALVFERHLLFTPGSSIHLDATYFAKKYFSIGPGSSYSFGRLVAATIFHIGPESTAYTAPVTYGAFPELTYDFGLVAALLIMFCIGALIAVLEAKARRATLSGYIICLAAALAIYDFVNKGGLIYLFINWAIVTIFLLAVSRLYLVLTTTHRSLLLPSVGAKST